MPPNPHYESVRKAVIAACPELMESSFGCCIKIKIKDRIMIDTIAKKNRAKKQYQGVKVLFYEDEITEIIGHTIRLSHILRTINSGPKSCYVHAGGEIVVHHVMWEDPVLCDWNLTKDDLAQQDPSVWEALDKMLT